MNFNLPSSSMIPFSKEAPLKPHLVNASKEINVIEEINKSILARRVTPMFQQFSLCKLHLHLPVSYHARFVCNKKINSFNGFSF